MFIASSQDPYDWWTGYHEQFGKGERSKAAWEKGVVRPYTQKRLFSLLDWAATQWEVDRSRVFVGGVSMGGSGSPMLAIRHPEKIAWAIGWVGVHIPHLSPTFKSSYREVYGDPEWGVKFEDGTPVWDYFNDVWYLRKYPARETPFITWSNGKNDGSIGWPQAVEFYKAMQETKRPHLFVWGQDGHGQRAKMPKNHGEGVMPIDIRIEQSLPAFTRCSLDGNPGNGDPNDGDKEGSVNYWLYWETKDIVDEAAVWELTVGLLDKAPKDGCSVDLTPRRLQKFRTPRGAKFAYTVTDVKGGKELSRSEAVADENGLLTLVQIPLVKGENRVRITPVK
jgi:pimeloyl-ACP methyl ester carboxylesterase